ncbi:unnamed protein product [Adineta steineri]|uniref:Fibronectin type-III domain-containing protein n=1 Tax=Adineta steineri TaxID=433720 RepID=A0A814W7F1_9BILA|nr:unnamed protein product [Adineta steineri]CAF3933927.1 unnamed protein product [Adineta steineri]
MMTATTIDYFSAIYSDEENATDTIYVYDTFIILWIKVSDRPSPEYSCQVRINDTDKWHPADFLNDSTTIAIAPMVNLDPYTFYVFTLNCDGVVENLKREYRTKIGRPSPPQNLTVEKNLTSVLLTWSPPLKPARPDYYYQLTVYPKLLNANLSQTVLSYEMTIGYQPGIHLVYIEACNEISSNATLCSRFTRASFTIETTTTTSQSTTTRSRSTALSYSLFVFLFSLSYLYTSK